MIREIKPEDIEEAMVLLEILRLNTPYRGVVPDWSHILDVMVNKMTRRDGLVLVAEHEKKLTGIMICSTEPLWWGNPNNGPKIASDLVFYSQRFGDGKRMLRRFTEWAFTVPRVIRAELAVSSAQAPLNVMRRLYEGEGYVLEGTLFVKNHPRYQAIVGPPQESAAA